MTLITITTHENMVAAHRQQIALAVEAALIEGRVPANGIVRRLFALPDFAPAQGEHFVSIEIVFPSSQRSLFLERIQDDIAKHLQKIGISPDSYLLIIPGTASA